jgi:hypothetical protein
MGLYRKKPITVEARQFESKDPSTAHINSLCMWSGGEYGYDSDVGNYICIKTSLGNMRAVYGDWIIKEPFQTGDRKFSICKPHIFEYTYEPDIFKHAYEPVEECKE